MSDQEDCSTSEAAENLVPTPPFASDNANVLPAHSVGRRNRSEAWNHFTIEPGSEKRAKCDYCSSLIASLGEDMAKTIELCLDGWGLNRVFCLTADNVSPNDFGIQYLKKRLMSLNSLVLKGDYIHICCCAHILNMIVKERFEDIDDSILRISAAVEYIRSSPSTLSKFEALAEQEKIDIKGPVCLDVETKWNLTYEMLKAALKCQKTF